jgi:5-formyltetrahydrofolate cyclo-ligase
MNKSELRKLFLQKRKALTQTEVNRRSELISRRFLDFLDTHQLVNTFGTIHAFLPIQQQHEVDTWLIIRSIWKLFSHIQIAVSITDTATNQLTNYPLYPHTQLQLNRWGIPEPINPNLKTAIPSHQFDIVLVPLLVFDNQGHRVGYGKGYYDRFLADCRPDSQKVGLSLFKPVEHIDNTELTDVRLNACITPGQTYFF